MYIIQKHSYIYVCLQMNVRIYIFDFKHNTFNYTCFRNPNKLETGMHYFVINFNTKVSHHTFHFLHKFQIFTLESLIWILMTHILVNETCIAINIIIYHIQSQYLKQQPLYEFHRISNHLLYPNHFCIPI